MCIKSYQLIANAPVEKLKEVLDIFSETASQVCEGQQYDMNFEEEPFITLEDYMHMIGLKTAVLVACSAKMGAIIGGAEKIVADALYNFAYKLGLAFQIKDDLLDYENSGLTGKITGNDIKERKLTLPLIHALDNTSFSTRRHIMSIVRNKKKTTADINEVIDFVKLSGGPEYTAEKMIMYRDSALEILSSYPPSDVRESLSRFVNYTVSREK